MPPKARMRPAPILAALLALPLLAGPALPTAALAQDAAQETAPEPAPDAPWRDPALGVEARVADLLARMTLEEKIGQTAQVNLTRLTTGGEWARGPLDPEQVRRVVVERGVGSILSGGGFAPVPDDPAGWVAVVTELQRAAVEDTRLGVPLVYAVDAVHGHNNLPGAALLPHQIGLAATFDAARVEEAYAATARALRATGVRWNFAPVLDAGVEPRWGRFFETFGSDPFLIAELGAAAVRGHDAHGVAATAKHVVGYGAPEGGVDRAPAHVPLRALRDEHLPPVDAAVEAGVPSAMANSGAVNGVPVHASAELLRGALRARTGFDGPIVSDWQDIDKLETVHGVAASFDDALVMAFEAGVDVVMLPHDVERYADAVARLVREGRIPEAQVDEAAGRMLAFKMRLGLFEEPYPDPDATAPALPGPAELAQAADLARASLTELEPPAAPPLEEGALLVIAPGGTPRRLAGGWTLAWQGAPMDAALPGEGVAEAVRRLAPAGVEVRTLDAWRSATTLEAALAEADRVLVVVGEEPYAEGEGAAINPALALPAAEAHLLESVAASDVPWDLALVSGRPLDLPDAAWSDPDRGALWMAYLPGTGGGVAIAEAALGLADPAGRLPFPWPRDAAELPVRTGAAHANAPEPRWGFGHGAEHARERVLDAFVDGDEVVVLLELTPLLDSPAEHVAIVWADAPAAPVLTPARRPVGWTRARLEPDAPTEVEVRIPLERLAVTLGDVSGDGARVVPGGAWTFDVAGGSGASVRIDAPVPIEGPWLEGGY